MIDCLLNDNATPEGFHLTDFLEAGYTSSEAVNLAQKGAIILNTSELSSVIEAIDNESDFLSIIKTLRDIPRPDNTTIINMIHNMYCIDTVLSFINMNHDIKTNKESYKLINEAIKAGCGLEFIKKLVKSGVNPCSCKDERSCENPIRVALNSRASDEIIEFLKSAGIRYEMDYDDYTTLLINEFMKDKPDDNRIKECIENGADYTGYNIGINDVLLVLIRDNAKIENIELLLGYGAPVNYDNFYASPLVYAIEQHASDNVIRFLLRKGAELLPSGDFDETYFADRISRDEYMNERIAEKTDDIYNDSSFEDMYGPDEDDVEYEREQAIEFAYFDIEREWEEIVEHEEEIFYSATALMFAVRSFSKVSVLDILVEAGADINKESVFYVRRLRYYGDGSGPVKLSLTPLTVAILIDNKEAMEYLFQKEARINDRNGNLASLPLCDLVQELRKCYVDYDIDDLRL